MDGIWLSGRFMDSSGVGVVSCFTITLNPRGGCYISPGSNHVG